MHILISEYKIGLHVQLLTVCIVPNRLPFLPSHGFFHSFIVSNAYFQSKQTGKRNSTTRCSSANASILPCKYHNNQFNTSKDYLLIKWTINVLFSIKKCTWQNIYSDNIYICDKTLHVLKYVRDKVLYAMRYEQLSVMKYVRDKTMYTWKYVRDITLYAIKYVRYKTLYVKKHVRDLSI